MISLATRKQLCFELLAKANGLPIVIEMPSTIQAKVLESELRDFVFSNHLLYLISIEEKEKRVHILPLQ